MGLRRRGERERGGREGEQNKQCSREAGVAVPREGTGVGVGGCCKWLKVCGSRGGAARASLHM